MRHAGGKNGQARMKAVTIALLSLIAKRSGRTPADLEGVFELGLRDRHDKETGQEWRRYTHPATTTNRKENQALSVEKLFEIARRAVELDYVTQKDLWRIHLIDLESPEAAQARITNERLAHQTFLHGKALLLAGKMPMAPGGKSGGRPRAPRSANEAADSYWAWTKKIEALGCSVFEDRRDVSHLDDWLIEFLGLEWAPRELTAEDYELLHPAERPLDPANQHIDALRRLRIRFSFGWVDEPWHLQCESFRLSSSFETSSNMDIEALFLELDRMLQEAA